MPELPEVEAYRGLAAGVVGRTVRRVEVRDHRFVRRGTTVADLDAALAGARVVAARRRGKLLILDVVPARRHGRELAARRSVVGGDDGRPAERPPTPGGAEPGTIGIGLHFGMAGRLLVDGCSPIARLLSTSDRAEPAWDRMTLHFVGGGTLVVRDPRLLGGVWLRPDEDALGPDAGRCTLDEVVVACRASGAPLKARLLDQTVLAGIGNLVADELLWRAGLAPGRPASSLDADECRRLHRAIRSTLRMLIARGGSHTGDLMAARRPGGVCPRDGAALRRDRIGGRTTFWCPEHQR